MTRRHVIIGPCDAIDRLFLSVLNVFFFSFDTSVCETGPQMVCRDLCVDMKVLMRNFVIKTSLCNLETIIQLRHSLGGIEQHSVQPNLGAVGLNISPRGGQVQVHLFKHMPH